jgi:arylsulfatase A-like enzyme
MRFLSTIVVVGLISFSCGRKAPDRPNIIYIMVDDMGYADLSIYGRKDYTTPVLDRLAHEGMMFTNAYAAAPVCTPTRVAFMTGRFPQRIPIGLREPLLMDSTDMDMGLSPENTLSTLLKKSGYRTALFGKWHLGFNPEFMPLAHGFDEFFGIISGGADYVTHRYEGKDVLYEGDHAVKKEGYLTDLITDYAVNYISRMSGPFFISLQYTSPHWPWQGPGNPPYNDTTKMSSGGSTEIYARMVQNLDVNVGRILKSLEDAGLKNNTLIIFTSDNGGEKYSDMGPLRGRKFNLWEGGIRVPALVRWPGKIKPHTLSEQVVVTMDWTATILSAAKVPALDDYPFDGVNLIPVLEGGKEFDRKLYWRVTNRERWDAYRNGDWKYLKSPQEEGLYNLAEDPGESNNLKDKQTEKFLKFKSEFQNLDKEMLEPYVFKK